MDKPFKRHMKKISTYRIIEISIILIFLAAAVATAFLVAPLQDQDVTTAGDPGSIQAVVSYMPVQGWTPLEVNFGAGDSYSKNGEIIKYEWDLDGNGRFDTDATGTNGYVSYNYQDNGNYDVSLRITDEMGYSSTATVPVNIRHPGSSSVDYWTVFDDSQVRKVTISLRQSDWDLIWSDIEAKHQVPADAVIFGEKLEDVGFSMRGQFSMRESGDKKPWKINTDAFIADQEFHNLKQLVFTNNIGDYTMLQEKLSYDMMHFAGVPASHVCFVEIWIDIRDDDSGPQFWGVYTMIERIDAKFISNRFSRDAKDGNRYKASHAQRGPMDLVYYGPDIGDYPTQNGQYAYGKENNLEDPDYSDIIELCYVVDGKQYSTPQDFAQALEEVFNVDSFLRYMAVISLTMNWDSYPWTGNNFFLFNNPVTGKFEWIPWDLTWGGDISMPVFERSAPAVSPYAPLFENVFQVEKYRRQYSAYMDLLMKEFFNYENIYQLSRKYHDMIAPFVTQATGDKSYFGDTAWFPAEQFDSSWKDLAVRARERSNYVKSVLNGMEENNN